MGLTEYVIGLPILCFLGALVGMLVVWLPEYHRLLLRIQSLLESIDRKTK